MKKNININLCGRLFNIDEDAYELLKNYTDSLRGYYRRQEGGEEIADDIEQRIAELLDELKRSGTEAITIEHVQDIIRRIGELSEIASDDTGDGSQMNDEHGKTSATPLSSWVEGLRAKKYYRDSREKMLGGVLSGCAKYFGGNVVLWRIGFLLLSIVTIKTLLVTLPMLAGWIFNPHASSIIWLLVVLAGLVVNSAPTIIYAIVYFLTPETKSPEDRLKMKGEEVNAQTLGEEVSRQDEYDKNEKARRPHGCIHGFFSVVVACVKLVMWLVGLAMFIPFIILACCMIYIYISPIENLNNLLGTHAMEVYESQPHLFWILGSCLLLVTFIPAYSALHWALNTFGKIREMGGYQRITLVLLWIFAVGGAIASGTMISFEMDKISTRKWQENREAEKEFRAAHTHDGIFFNDADWAFFSEGGWRLLKHFNCTNDRYTYSGQYYTGDESVRYLDAYAHNYDLIYQAEKTDTVQPGLYEVVALARSEEHSRGACIYAYLGEEGQAFQLAVAEIPQYGNSKPDNHDEVLPYGWTVVRTPTLEVKTAQPIHYGVSTDPAFTERDSHVRWFSATDFKVRKVEAE